MLWAYRHSAISAWELRKGAVLDILQVAKLKVYDGDQAKPPS